MMPNCGKVREWEKRRKNHRIGEKFAGGELGNSNKQAGKRSKSLRL
jgi:hypothetical protein